jgi:hypothetical protein
MRHVITLSTIPPRFAQIGPTLLSLLKQKARPEAVELYIPQSYRRFPQWGGALPAVPEGVTIIRVEEDLGPATKVLPAARAWRGQEVELIYGDDDRVFSPHWTATCLALRKDHPTTAICGGGFSIEERYGYRFAEKPMPRAVPAADPRDQLAVHLHSLLRSVALRRNPGPKLKPQIRRFAQSGYTDIAEGYGGVMVRPDFFDDAAFVIPPVLWAVDDVWLSGTLARRGIPIWADKALYKVSEIVDTSLHYPLHKAVLDGASREEANRACIDYMRERYGIWGGVAVQST